MAKAIRIHQFGGPEVLRFEELDVGQPGEGEVLVGQRAIGLNYIDIYQRGGIYPNPLPLVLGNEASGDVLAVGPGVEEFRPGDRVAYGTALGAYAEQRIVAAKHLVKLPDAIDYDIGAVMMLKGMTAQYLLRRTHRVGPEDVILVQAAAGGVGLILCQWAKALGATVIGTAGTPEKAELARQHGADHVILYRTEDVAARVKEITGGRKCTVVYDAVGQATFEGSIDSLRPLGLLASFGAASGQIPAFNVSLLAQKGSLFLTRPTLFTYAAERQDLLAMAKDVTEAITSGTIKIDVHSRVPLRDTADAHRALEARDTVGATVLIP